jgi:hypothetical protein
MRKLLVISIVACLTLFAVGFAAECVQAQPPRGQAPPPPDQYQGAGPWDQDQGPPPWDPNQDPWEQNQPPQGQYQPPRDQAPPPRGQVQPPMGQYPPPRGQYGPPRDQAPPPRGGNPFVGLWVGYCEFGGTAANTDSTEVTLEVREQNGRLMAVIRNGLGTRDQLFHDHTADPDGRIYNARIQQTSSGRPILLLGNLAFTPYGNQIEAYRDNGHNTHHYRLWRVR